MAAPRDLQVDRHNLIFFFFQVFQVGIFVLQVFQVSLLLCFFLFFSLFFTGGPGKYDFGVGVRFRV